MNLTIWASTNVKIKHKIPHVKKAGGKVTNSFCIDDGDIPVACWNEETMQWMPVENTRGLAYAYRKRFKYRKNKKRALGSIG